MPNDISPSPHPKVGVLLLNLGTPTDPHPRAVGKYLREFLMDPLVVDIPWLFRWILVRLLIVPRRSKSSAKLYQKIWGPEGSPLLHFLRSFGAKVQGELGDGFAVEAAMRYGVPSITSAVESLKRQGVERVVCFPLYPQYSLAATESSIKAVRESFARIFPRAELRFVPAFFSDARYLDAVARVSAPFLKEASHQKFLFSFHGLPERQVKKTDDTGSYCLARADCCERQSEANRDCYRFQCFATARALAERLGIAKPDYEVCFQSRLGRTPWIRPYTDTLYRELPARGIKNVAVLCPSFVADCLETLEEVAIRGREEFLRHGGTSLDLVPSLNDADVWVSGAAAMIRQYAGIHQPRT